MITSTPGAPADEHERRSPMQISTTMETNGNARHLPSSDLVAAVGACIAR
jgi:hypothetical protein